MKKLIKKVLKMIIFILDYVIPKKKNQILFGSNGTEIFSGNAKYLYEKFKTNKNYRIKYYERNHRSNNDYIDLKTMKGFVYFLRTKYLIGTHGLGDFVYPLSNKKTFIQTWHGSPLKKMGLCDANRSCQTKKLLSNHVKKITYFLSSSEIVTSSLIRCFGIEEEKVLNIGYPRNDHLVNCKKKGNLAVKFNVKKVILYAPTFRDWNEVKLFPFDSFSFKNLEKILEENDAIMLVRSHINEKEEGNIKGKRVIEFGFDKCQEINEILGEIDLLITDYSSIYFDYLLLNRPSIFLPYDLSEYQEKRGLLYNNYESLMIGDLPNSQEEFFKSLKINLNKDVHAKERGKVNKLFNYNQTSNTYKILLNKLEEEAR